MLLSIDCSGSFNADKADDVEGACSVDEDSVDLFALIVIGWLVTTSWKKRYLNTSTFKTKY